LIDLKPLEGLEEGGIFMAEILKIYIVFKLVSIIDFLIKKDTNHFK